MKVQLELASLEGIAIGQARKGMRSALARGVGILRGDILSRPGQGRVYGKHRASAPGDPPAPDTGNLRNKIEADEIDPLPDGGIVGHIRANSAQAEALEVGTERTAARPFLLRLLNEHGPDLIAAFWAGARRDG